MEIGRRSICQEYRCHTKRAGEVHAARVCSGSYGRPGPVQNPTSGPSFVSPSRWCAAEQNLKPPLSHPLSPRWPSRIYLCPLTADFQTNEGRVGPVGPSTAPTRTPDGYVPTRYIHLDPQGTYMLPGPASVRAKSQPDRLFAKGIKRIVSLPFWDPLEIRWFLFFTRKTNKQYQRSDF